MSRNTTNDINVPHGVSPKSRVRRSLGVDQGLGSALKRPLVDLQKRDEITNLSHDLLSPLRPHRSDDCQEAARQMGGSPAGGLVPTRVVPTRTSGCPGIWVSGRPGVRVSGFPVSGVRVSGCIVARSFFLLALWINCRVARVCPVNDVETTRCAPPRLVRGR